MQIPSIPPPIVTNSLPQDVTAKAVPNIQAMAPLVQNAVAPTPKSEKFNQSRSNKDKAKSSDKNNHKGNKEDDRGSSVNIRV